MIIVGAGMAGLIAANYFRKQNPKVIEQQSTLPNNHHALLRFKTSKVADAVGIGFRKVRVQKGVVAGTTFLDKANPYAANQYSLKVSGKLSSRSVWNLEPDDRYIAPPDFINQLANGVDLTLSTGFQFTAARRYDAEPVISTIPMPIMMKMAGWKHYPHFEYRPIWALTATLDKPDADVYQTIYFSSLEQPYYRASIVGNKFIVEFVADVEDGWVDDKTLVDWMNEVIDFFGVPVGSAFFSNVEYKKQAYGKIVPVDDGVRKEFMYTLTKEHNIYSLGRFATWRQILLDDLVNDLMVIERLIGLENNRRLYHQSLTASGKI